MVEQLFVFNSYRALPGNEEAIGSALREVAQKIRRHPGCRFMHIFRSAQNPGHFMVHTGWDGKETVETFFRLPYVKQFLDDILPLTDRPLDASLMHRLD